MTGYLYYAFVVGRGNDGDAKKYNDCRMTNEDIVRDLLSREVLFDTDIVIESGETIKINCIARSHIRDELDILVDGFFEALFYCVPNFTDHYDVFVYEAKSRNTLNKLNRLWNQLKH